MKILFLLRHGLYLRNYESTIRGLAERGHHVHMGFLFEPVHEHLDVGLLTRTLTEAHPTVTSGFFSNRGDSWTTLARDVRSARNLLHYYEPWFSDATKLRKRASKDATGPAHWFVRLPGIRTRRGRRAAHAALRFIERSIPAEASLLQYVVEQRPDVLFVSPFIDGQLEQVDVVKAAQELGIPTVFGVASWDNLTTKGTVQVMPERVLVWNEAQRREAIDMHKVPPAHVVATGAQLYDHWFGRNPTRTRESFCEMRGFDPERPIAMYVGSSGFISGEDELPFVERWLKSLRAADDPVVAQANVLIRPHPTNAHRWGEAGLEAYGSVAVWPRTGAVPMDDDSKADYFDSLYHSAAVIGINTSALVEASIVGRRPLTVLDASFVLTQQGTPHFRHLTEGGYLATAADLTEHRGQLATELRRWPTVALEVEAFVTRFLRPFGQDQAATPRVVDAIESAAGQPCAPRPRGLVHRAVAAMLSPVARWRWRQAKPRSHAERRARAEMPAAPQSLVATELLSAEIALPHEAALRSGLGALEARIASARESVAYRNYLSARDYVQRLLETSAVDTSDYWREELAGFDYLSDASPLVVERLRQHAYHITGIRPHDYRRDDRHGCKAMAGKLRTLEGLDRRKLLVPESRCLGGFGYEIGGNLYNVDTLKFYECLLTLDRAGLLPADDDPKRRVVLEIGAGWGGFAHQFLTRFPGKATYVIVDLPGTLLFSVTYLSTLLPGARIALCDERNLSQVLAHWSEYDLIFIPATAWSRVDILPVDLAINMVSFQEMTAHQVDNYAARLADLGCCHLYSLNRERSPHNFELTSVSSILNQYYDLAPQQIVDVQYTQWTADKQRRRKYRDPAKDGSYRHLVGTRKSTPPAAVWMADSSRGAVARAAHHPRPRIVLGMPAYNETDHLREALDSLLAQTHGDFRLVVCDDSTNPEAGEIVRRYAAVDRRIEYRPNAKRLGMVGNWRECFAASGSDCDYFAWVSDHDLWHPEWLEKLSATLQELPEVSLAYPSFARITAEGRRAQSPPQAFDTFGLPTAARLARLRTEGRSFGNMVYGLYRVEAVRRAGVFRGCLLPDVLLLWELSLAGSIKQVHEELWYRRYTDRASLARQRTSLFVEAPWYLSLPWPVVQWASLAWNHLLRPSAGGIPARRDGAQLIAAHFARYASELYRTAPDDPADSAERPTVDTPLRLSKRDAAQATEMDSNGSRVELSGPHWERNAEEPKRDSRDRAEKISGFAPSR